MKIDNRAWFTLYDSQFNENEYLYHFTDIDKAIKILNNDSLKFGYLGNTNDTLESKPKIDFANAEDNKNLSNAIKHFKDLNEQFLQLLCFTKDLQKRKESVAERILYTDYSGRGFSLPRMWAQYSNNNSGICLVFNKNQLIKMIEKEVGGALIHYGDIEYKSQFQNYEFSKERLNELLDLITRNNSKIQTGIYDVRFLIENMDFVKYNYFSKLDDWKAENEFRFLAYGDQPYFVRNISKALTGIIIGEKIEPEDEKIIKYFCNDLCEIKKITFAFRGCKLSNIN